MRNVVTKESAAKGETKARGAAWLIIMIVVLMAGLVSPASAQIQVLKTDYTNPAPPADRQPTDPDWASKVCGGSTFAHNPTPIFEWGPVFGDEAVQCGHLFPEQGCIRMLLRAPTPNTPRSYTPPQSGFGVSQAEIGINGQESTSRVVHRRWVLPAARASVRCR